MHKFSAGTHTHTASLCGTLEFRQTASFFGHTIICVECSFYYIFLLYIHMYVLLRHLQSNSIRQKSDWHENFTVLIQSVYAFVIALCIKIPMFFKMKQIVANCDDDDGDNDDDHINGGGGDDGHDSVSLSRNKIPAAHPPFLRLICRHLHVK